MSKTALTAPAPAYTQKVNIRVTTAMRKAIGSICKREDLGEMDAMRYLIEAGLMVAAKRGLPGVMAKRSEFLAGQYPPPAVRSGRKPQKRR